MKKCLPIFKFFSIAFALMLMASVAKAATRTASVTGNWNQTATWGGATIPVAGDDVIINSGITVTVTVNAACATITFPTGNAANSTINVNSGISLTVSGLITIPRAGSTGTTPINTLAVGAGTVNAGSVTFTSGGNNVRHQITISTGTLDVSGNVAGTAGNTSGTISMSGAGSVKVGGTLFDPADGTLDAATGTVEYDGAGAQTIIDFVYGNLSTSGGGIKTMSAATTVSGNLTIGSGTTLNAAAFTTTLGNASVVTVNGTLDFTSSTGLIRTGTNQNATLTMGSNGLLRTVDALGIGPVANASLQTQGTGTWTTTSISTNGTVEYYAGAAQALTDRDYNNLLISTTAGTKTWTLAAARTINGDFTMGANAPVTFAGGQTLNLKGDWEDNSTGTFTQGTTLINFNGSAAQVVRGTQATTFTNITFNNTLPGTGIAITFTTQSFVNGVATFTDGIVSTNGSLITFNNGSSVASPSNASHIDGPMKKLGNAPGGTFRFPSGDAGQYEYLEIVATTAYDFTAQYNRTSATALSTTFINPVKNVSACDHWVLNPGTSVPTATVSVTLSWTDLQPCGGSNFVTLPSALTVAHLRSTPSVAWDQAGTGGSGGVGSSNSGSVTRTGVSVFSPFSIGNTAQFVNPLPVTFADVKAFEKGTGVQIEWSNLTEKDLVNYVVERSTNGRDFTTLNLVAPRSNQNDKESYISFDASPFAGANFYRIKTVEIDGKIGYSKVLKVEIGKTTKGIVFYPNPVTGSAVSISFTAAKGQYTLQVLNNAGQTVYSKQLVHPGGTVSQSVELPSSLKTGVYNLVLSGDNYKENKMFIMQ